MKQPQGQGALTDVLTVVDIGENLRNGAMHENSGKKLPPHVDWSAKGRSGRVYKQESTHYIATDLRPPKI